MADEITPPPAGSPPVSQPAPASQPDVAALIADALKAERDRVATESAKAKELADADAAAKRGEFEKLYAEEKAKRETAEAAATAARTSIELRDYLAEKHPTLAPAVAKYILPLIPAGLSDKARVEAIAAEVDAFAKVNPPATVKQGGVPLPRGPFTGKPNDASSTGNAGADYVARTYRGPNRFQNQQN